MKSGDKTYPVVIVGAGQAGLATSYFLKKRKIDFIILEENKNVGDNWRKRWDSLHLFTPSQYDGLPGMEFPLQKDGFPGKDQVADFLKAYIKKFDIPVQVETKVNKLTKVAGGNFLLETSSGNFIAERVVIATGTHPIPEVPDFSSQLSSEIVQIHSSAYKNPEMLNRGSVLVVGAGTSGIEIAIELSGTHETYISGKPTFHIPDNIFKYAGKLYWWFALHILTINTPVGRKAKDKILHGGGPLIKISAEDLDKAGVKRLPRMKGVKDGFPEFEDGTVLKVSTVIWATGYRPDFSWIQIEGFDKTGWPAANRGIAINQNGLYFMGMPFQFGLVSGLIGGVGRDAEFIVKNLVQSLQKKSV